MIKRTLLVAIAMSLTAAAAHADEQRLSKPQGAGMLTGAAAGALVGGPVGAVVGLMIGSVIGGSVEQAQRADSRARNVEDLLLEARRQLAAASRRKESDDLLAALAQRMRSDVLFKSNSSQVDVRVQDQLAALGKLLASHPELAVQLHGFADPRGQSEQNLVLSLERADVMREALLGGGAAPEQIHISAHGEDLTTASKNDVEAYAWERRVNLVLQPMTTQVAQSR